MKTTLLKVHELQSGHIYRCDLYESTYIVRQSPSGGENFYIAYKKLSSPTGGSTGKSNFSNPDCKFSPASVEEIQHLEACIAAGNKFVEPAAVNNYYEIF